MSVIVARSSGGGTASSTSSGLTQSFSGSLQPLSSSVVDTVLLGTVTSIKWLVTITTTDSRMCGYEVFAIIKPDDTTMFTAYAILGDTIQHEFDVVIAASNIELVFVNNEPVEQLVINGTRIGVAQ